MPEAGTGINVTMPGESIARETIAISMLAAVLGGLAFQVPIGRLSDRFDRRIVLAALGLGFAGAASTIHLWKHPCRPE